MASRLRKVVGAVKDQTSISLALVALRGSSSTLEVAVLKATTHDELPVNDRYATEVLLLASSSPSAAAAAAIALRRRISRTSDWVVALKTLTVVYGTIIDAGPEFRREAAMRHLLDLSSFRSSPWDFTAFVRTYALYLDARLQSSLQGYISLRRRCRRPPEVKAAVILDRIRQWQQLLDRAVGTRPTGPAKDNRLVQISLCSVVRESFDLYDDVSEGISLLLDNFVQLPYPTRVTTVEACRKTARLFEDLDEFYAVCKKIGIGRESEYPTVQKISKQILEQLNENLNDRHESSNPPSDTAGSPRQLLLRPTESIFNMDVTRRRGSSMDKGQRKLHAESSSPIASIHHNSLNPFLDDETPSPTLRTASLRMNVGTEKGTPPASLRMDFGSERGTPTRGTPTFRTASAREEDIGIQRNSFDKSPWIQSKLDEASRKQLRWEQEQWMQHQNRFIERNLAFL